jgi:hypothetical protein
VSDDPRPLSYLRQISPVLEHTSDKMLLEINREWAHGIVRLWANLVEECLENAGDGPPPTRITPQVWADALVSLGKRHAPR